MINLSERKIKEKKNVSAAYAYVHIPTSQRDTYIYGNIHVLFTHLISMNDDGAITFIYYYRSLK